MELPIASILTNHVITNTYTLSFIVIYNHLASSNSAVHLYLIRIVFHSITDQTEFVKADTNTSTSKMKSIFLFCTKKSIKLFLYAYFPSERSTVE